MIVISVGVYLYRWTIFDKKALTGFRMVPKMEVQES